MPQGEDQEIRRKLVAKVPPLCGRTSRTAGPFLPLDPPPLPRRATAARLDPEAALAPWLDALPSASIEAGRAYLERLAEEGVREPEAEGSP